MTTTPWTPGGFNGWKQDPQTIHAPFAAWIRLNDIALPADAVSIDLTTALTSAALTAGRNSQPVPMQVMGTIDARGFVASAGTNRVLIYNGVTREKVKNPDEGVEVFGRLTHSAGVYTVSFYSLNTSGVETAYLMPDGTYDYLVKYNFDFHELPNGAFTEVEEFSTSQDMNSGGSPLVVVDLVATAANTLPALSPPFKTGTFFRLNYNGWVGYAGALKAFTVNTTTGVITWSAAQAGFSIPIGATVSVEYLQP